MGGYSGESLQNIIRLAKLSLKPLGLPDADVFGSLPHVNAFHENTRNIHVYQGPGGDGIQKEIEEKLTNEQQTVGWTSRLWLIELRSLT